ncbi:hypothetical protein ACPXB5_11495 [Micromonospora arida]|uniref:hypothetical protein n=1 Tax=Micromonospora arida TaxID=2203715 RepID=UPI003CE6D818
MTARGPLTAEAYATLIAASLARLDVHAPDAARAIRTDFRSRVNLGLAFAESIRRGMVRGVTPDGRALLAHTLNTLSDLLDGKADR